VISLAEGLADVDAGRDIDDQPMFAKPSWCLSRVRKRLGGPVFRFSGLIPVQGITFRVTVACRSALAGRPGKRRCYPATDFNAVFPSSDDAMRLVADAHTGRAFFFGRRGFKCAMAEIAHTGPEAGCIAPTFLSCSEECLQLWKISLHKK
jgi:hypothetical protein